MPVGWRAIADAQVGKEREKLAGAALMRWERMTGAVGARRRRRRHVDAREDHHPGEGQDVHQIQFRVLAIREGAAEGHPAKVFVLVGHNVLQMPRRWRQHRGPHHADDRRDEGTGGPRHEASGYGSNSNGVEECVDDHVGGGGTGSGGRRRLRLARGWRAARKAAEAKADWECGRPLGGPWRRRQDAFINRPQRKPQRRGREGTR